MASVAASAMIKAPVASRNVTSFKSAKAGKAAFVSNATIKRTTANIKVWQPVDNKVRLFLDACMSSNSLSDRAVLYLYALVYLPL